MVQGVLGVFLDVHGAPHLVSHAACAVRVGAYRWPGSLHPPPGAPLGGPGSFFSRALSIADRWLTEEQYSPDITELECTPLVCMCQCGPRVDTEPSNHWPWLLQGQMGERSGHVEGKGAQERILSVSHLCIRHRPRYSVCVFSLTPLGCPNPHFTEEQTGGQWG